MPNPSTATILENTISSIVSQQAADDEAMLQACTAAWAALSDCTTTTTTPTTTTTTTPTTTTTTTPTTTTTTTPTTTTTQTTTQTPNQTPVSGSIYVYGDGNLDIFSGTWTIVGDVEVVSGIFTGVFASVSDYTCAQYASSVVEMNFTIAPHEGQPGFITYSFSGSPPAGLCGPGTPVWGLLLRDDGSASWT